MTTSQRVYKKEISDYHMVIENKAVWEFYDKHPNLDFESTNVMLVDILDKIMQTTQDSLNASVSKQILNDIRAIKDQMTTFKVDVSTVFSEKFDEYKTNYMDNLKILFATNLHSTVDKILPMMDKFSDILQDKMRLLILDTVLKNQESLSKSETSITRDIMLQVKYIQDSVSNDTKKMLSTTVNSDSISAFMATIDDKFAKTLVNSQEIFNTVLASTESRITASLNGTNTRIDQMRTVTNANMASQFSTNTGIEELLRKLENSSIKGKIGENLLMSVIQNLYPIAEIQNVGSIKESCDIVMIRNDRPTIMFENKNYENSVNRTEVEKFYRDIEIQNCSAIMVSQKSAIVGKHNFEIELVKGNVIIFLHNVNYCGDVIKTAVDIIDHFKGKLVEIEDKSGDPSVFEMDIATMSVINHEFRQFIISKNTMIRNFKENNARLIGQLEVMNLPSLEVILNQRYSSSSISDRDEKCICTHCGYIGKNSRSLSSHVRGCKNKNVIISDGNDSI